MKRTLSMLVVGLAAALGPPGETSAAEPYQQFVEGLRERGYYDYALLYLDSLADRPGVPDEVRQAVPFEKAATLQQQAHLARSAALKQEYLNQAEALLQRFTKEHPLHPKAAEANTQRARILLGRAEVAVWQSNSPQNTAKKGEYQRQARELIGQARAIFQKAHDQHEQRWKTFPTFIDEQEQPRLYEQRREAEIAYIRAQLDLALCTYQEAQTYDPEDAQYGKLLTQAALEFEQIHTRYRSWPAGVWARLWQGKCFQEQDDVGKALGIYKDFLDGDNQDLRQQSRLKREFMKKVRDQALHFRLICLNHEIRRDYQLAIIQASEWLQQAGPRGQRTERALGIRWERARAYENRAEQLLQEIAELEKQRDEQLEAIRDNDQLSDRQKQQQIGRLQQEFSRQRDEKRRKREDALQAALDDAEEINQYAGQYKDVSTFMARRLRVALGADPEDPEDFAGALGIAESMKNRLAELDDRLADPANSDRRDEITGDRTDHLHEMARILNLALRLAQDEPTEKKQVDRARYLLAYVDYRLRRNYEASILGEFVARHSDAETASLGLDSAYLAMAAWVQAYNDAAGDDKRFEMDQMVRVCNLITDKWPESDKANEARLQLGRIYRQLDQPVPAAEWFGQVPQAAANYYAEAQISAGQAYWSAYLESARLPEDDPDRPTNDELETWRESAKRYLQTGIAEAAGRIPEGNTDVDVYDDYIAAKVSLAHVHIADAQYLQAIDLLTKPPHPVMQAVTIQDGQQRPEEGITSRPFAALAYQLLLRAYVGTQKIDDAMTVMDRLEKLAPNPEEVMSVYRRLGEELQNEIERLSKLGRTQRLAEVQASFQQFLAELFQRKQNMTAGQLLWIAETYYGLGKGMLQDDKPTAGSYFSKAAETYQDIIANAESKGAQWMDSERVTGVKLRLVNCRRHQGEFQQAFDLVAEVLKEKPKALDAQIEAAYVLQDWAGSGGADSWKRYTEAINGTEKDGVSVWGWGRTALLLQRRIDAGLGDEEQNESFYEAHYNAALCRLRYGKATSSTPRRKQAFEEAKQAVDALAAIVGNEVSDRWKGEFNRLYRDILAGMQQEGMTLAGGEPVVVQDLVWPENVEPVSTATVAQGGTKEPPPPPPPPPPEGFNWAYLIVALLLAGGAVYGVYYAMARQGTPRPIAAYTDSPPEFPSSSGATPRKKKRKAAKAPSSRAGGKSGTSTATRSPRNPKEKPS